MHSLVEALPWESAKEAMKRRPVGGCGQAFSASSVQGRFCGCEFRCHREEKTGKDSRQLFGLGRHTRIYLKNSNILFSRPPTTATASQSAVNEPHPCSHSPSILGISSPKFRRTMSHQIAAQRKFRIRRLLNQIPGDKDQWIYVR
jgi:hypothetical protein